MKISPSKHKCRRRSKRQGNKGGLPAAVNNCIKRTNADVSSVATSGAFVLALVRSASAGVGQTFSSPSSSSKAAVSEEEALPRDVRLSRSPALLLPLSPSFSLAGWLCHQAGTWGEQCFGQMFSPTSRESQKEKKQCREMLDI